MLVCWLFLVVLCFSRISLLVVSVLLFLGRGVVWLVWRCRSGDVKTKESCLTLQMFANVAPVNNENITFLLVAGNGGNTATFDLFDSESGQDLTLSPQTFTSSTEAFINDNSDSLGVPGDTDTGKPRPAPTPALLRGLGLFGKRVSPSGTVEVRLLCMR
jgi:hypothetical protein